MQEFPLGTISVSKRINPPIEVRKRQCDVVAITFTPWDVEAHQVWIRFGKTITCNNGNLNYSFDQLISEYPFPVGCIVAFSEELMQ